MVIWCGGVATQVGLPLIPPMSVLLRVFASCWWCSIMVALTIATLPSSPFLLRIYFFWRSSRVAFNSSNVNVIVGLLASHWWCSIVVALITIHYRQVPFLWEQSFLYSTLQTLDILMHWQTINLAWLYSQPIMLLKPFLVLLQQCW